MLISIIGGGPAGLYFACAIKSLNPHFDITVYEARNESVNSHGLGYTLQGLNTNLLSRLDAQYFESLFPTGSTPLITKALFKTNYDSRVLGFSEGFSVTRPQLMRYLHNRALELGVKCKEKKISAARVKRLQNSSDLLVGADGINSIVRNHFSSRFQAKTLQTTLRFSWFINETVQIRKEACFYAFQAPEGVIMLTSYPLTENRQVVIIEMTDNCLNSGQFRGKSPQEAEPYLNALLSSNGDEMSLKSAGLPWYTFNMNTTEQLADKNVALVGDAAFSFHYSAGQGLTTAFTMGYSLAHCLQKNADLTLALKHYSKSVQLMLAKPAAQSFADIRWFENIDSHFRNASTDDWLDLFLDKDKFDPFKSRVNAVN